MYICTYIYIYMYMHVCVYTRRKLYQLTQAPEKKAEHEGKVGT